MLELLFKITVAVVFLGGLVGCSVGPDGRLDDREVGITPSPDATPSMTRGTGREGYSDCQIVGHADSNFGIDKYDDPREALVTVVQDPERFGVKEGPREDVIVYHSRRGPSLEVEVARTEDGMWSVGSYEGCLPEGAE